MADRINIEDLRPAEGATKKTVRVGRGRSSGCGKTSSRGHNGEGQRSGRTSKRGFEGGQMPGYRQLPKLKGFKNVLAIKQGQINVKDLQALDLGHRALDDLEVIGTLTNSSFISLSLAHLEYPLSFLASVIGL